MLCSYCHALPTLLALWHLFVFFFVFGQVALAAQGDGRTHHPCPSIAGPPAGERI